MRPKRRLAWITDPHVNFVSDKKWFRDILNEKPDGILITGDIAESRSVVGALKMFVEETARPIYFVLGNHDFYRSSIAAVRREVRAFTASTSSAVYLHEDGIVRLTSDTTLVGVDGWYDGRNGSYESSSVRLTDFNAIDDFSDLDKASVRKRMEEITAESANYLRLRLRGCIDPRVKKIIVATHVPPFAGAAWHEGAVSDAAHLPFFSNRLVGDAILEETRTFREALHGKVEVYCGHTHSGGVIHVDENLLVCTGAAEYYSPALAGFIEYE